MTTGTLNMADNHNHMRTKRTKEEIRARKTEKPSGSQTVVPFTIRDIPTGCNPQPLPTEDSPFSWDVNSQARWDMTLDAEDLEDEIDHGLTEEYLVSKDYIIRCVV